MRFPGMILAALALGLAPPAWGKAFAGAEVDGSAQGRASEPGEQEKALLADAVRHFDQGEFREALRKLEEGYRRYGKAGYLYDLGQTHRQLKDCEAALAAYERFLAEAPAGHDKRPLADRRRAEMRACAKAVRPEIRPGASEALPAAEATAVRPGNPPAVEPADVPRPWARRTALALLAAGASAGLAAGYFGWRASSRSNELSSGRVEAGDRQRQLDREGRAAQDAAIWLSLGAIAAAGSGGTLLLVLAPAAGDRASDVRVSFGWSARF
jgi:tetratricopeptide (TPR) repeat protein